MVYDNKNNKALEGKDFTFGFNDANIFTDLGFNENTRCLGVKLHWPDSPISKNVSFLVGGTSIASVSISIKKPDLRWIWASSYSALPSATRYYSIDNPGITISKGSEIWFQLHNQSKPERYTGNNYQISVLYNQVSPSSSDKVVQYSVGTTSYEGYIKIKGLNKGTANIVFKYAYGGRILESSCIITVN